jgi:hypothetical protein
MINHTLYEVATTSITGAAATAPTRLNEHIWIFLIAIGVIGTVGNLLVAVVYWRKKDKQTSTFFILVLALSDLAVCSILVPFTIYMESIVFETGSRAVCKLYFFLVTTTVPNSSLIMAAIAFDRYFCICMVNRVILTLKRAKYLVTTLVCISGLLGVIPALSSVIRPQPWYVENATNHDFYFENETENSLVCTIDLNAELDNLVWRFKLFYDLIYACSVITITILYALIYKEIYVRRRMKRTRKQELLRNGCLVLTAAADETLNENSINRVIAITNPKVMNNVGSTLTSAQGPNRNSGSRKKNSSRYDEPASENENGVNVTRNRTSLKKCYCYFESKSNFKFFFC